MSGDRNFLVRLTLASHRVADTFSLKEQELALKIKNLSGEILADLILGKETVSEKIKELYSLFAIAEQGQLADKRNFLVLRREYDKIRKSLEHNSVDKSDFTLNRQQRIVNMLKSNGKIRLGELAPVFPQVNRRTILRDLDSLVAAGLVERQGNGRGTSYKLNGVKDKNATLIRT